MAKNKEDMARGLDSLLEGTPRKPVQGAGAQAVTKAGREGRDRTAGPGRPSADGTRERLTERYAYTSLALDRDLYAKLRAIALRHGLPYRDIINASIRRYIELYEAKHGPVSVSGKNTESADSLI